MTLEETDRLLSCPYCRVRFFLASRQRPRYYLPPANPNASDLIYAPYWRFKGDLFSCIPYQVEVRRLDATTRAVDIDALPRTLGLRPQVMAIHYAPSPAPSGFLPPTQPLEHVVAPIEQRLRNANQFRQPDRPYHTIFFGETYSLIYAPFHIEQDYIYDAISERRLGVWTPEAITVPPDKTDHDDWQIRFSPAICPDCGWDLEAGRDALVLICRHCRRAWQASAAGLAEIAPVFVRADKSTTRYLPFWRMKVKVDGLTLTSYADLIRVANLPKATRGIWENQDLYFWSPAFKVHPQLFLRLSRNTTLAQPTIDHQAPFVDVPLADVTLPVEEAAESIKTSLANISLAKRVLFPELPGIRIDLQTYRLVYFPFQTMGHELVNPDLKAAIDRRLLRPTGSAA